MGHKVGWLTLYAGMASGADIILLPEIPYDIDKVIEAIDKRTKAGKGFTILAVAEGAISKKDAELSKREKEVLALLARGYSLSVIAEKLYISIKTVSTYKTRLMQKLGFSQKHELVEYALKHNWLEKE